MRRLWIVWHYGEGRRKTVGSLDMSLSDAVAWLEEARGCEELWRQRFDGSVPFLFAEEVEATEQIWHIRYSDTPGGGWNVIEAMKSAGFSMVISSVKDGWRVTCDDGNPHHGNSSEIAPTMAEAACKLALRRIKPLSPQPSALNPEA